MNEHMINRIFNEDCLEGMKRIADKSIDMILCDLPYGTTACKWDTIIPFEPLWEQYERIIKDNGAIVLTASQPFATDLIMSKRKLFRYEWIWEKTKGGGFQLVNKQPLKRHENIYVFYKKQPTYNPQKYRVPENMIDKRKTINNSNSNKNSAQVSSGVCIRKKDDGTRFPKTVLQFNSVSGKGKHPTEKPVALFEYLIKTYTNEGDTVLDNCAGSFTTAVACDNLNRNWICMEKEYSYCEIGLTRINKNREMLNLPTLNSINSTIVL